VHFLQPTKPLNVFAPQFWHHVTLETFPLGTRDKEKLCLAPVKFGSQALICLDNVQPKLVKIQLKLQLVSYMAVPVQRKKKNIPK